VLFNIADHSLLYTHIPINFAGRSAHHNNNHQPHHHNSPPNNQPTQTFYKWVEGEDISEYSASANKWRRHTDTPEFVTKFNQIIEDNTISN
jgi:hypothetical protein